MNQEFKQEFLINAMSGATKTQLLRTYREELNCTDENIKELLNLPEIQKAPKFVNYWKFHKLKIPSLAKCYKFPFTKIYTQRNFLSKQECTELIEEIEDNLEPSCIANPDDRRTVSDYRTSSSASFNYRKTNIGTDTDLKISRYLKLDPFIGEWVQGQKYGPGEYYKEHHDFFHPFTEEYKTYTEWMGQRTWTFMVYLNDVKKGGETYFKHLNLAIKPERGMAVFWNNLYPFGWPNLKTMHEALPPLEEEKYIITKWFRSWHLIN